MRREVTLLFLLFPILLCAQTEANTWMKEGKYQEAWDYSLRKVEQGDTSFSTLELLGNAAFEITELKGNKKMSMEVIEQTIPYLLKYSFSDDFTLAQQARVFHKYNTLLAKKAQLQGVSASLKILPEIFDNADRCIALDSSFSEPYFVKVSIDDEVPAIVGDAAKRGENAKYRMGINLELALERDPENIYFLAQGASALLRRGWSIETRKKNKGTNGENRFLILSDKDEARQLLARAIAVYNTKSAPSPIETAKYQQAKNMQAKLH